MFWWRLGPEKRFLGENPFGFPDFEAVRQVQQASTWSWSLYAYRKDRQLETWPTCVLVAILFLFEVPYA